MSTRMISNVLDYPTLDPTLDPIQAHRRIFSHFSMMPFEFEYEWSEREQKHRNPINVYHFPIGGWTSFYFEHGERALIKLLAQQYQARNGPAGMGVWRPMLADTTLIVT